MRSEDAGVREVVRTPQSACALGRGEGRREEREGAGGKVPGTQGLRAGWGFAALVQEPEEGKAGCVYCVGRVVGKNRGRAEAVGPGVWEH